MHVYTTTCITFHFFPKLLDTLVITDDMAAGNVMDLSSVADPDDMVHAFDENKNDANEPLPSGMLSLTDT